MKRFGVILLSGILLATSVPMTGFAATSNNNKADVIKYPIRAEEPSSSSTEPSKVSLTAAIKTVKGKIAIPEEYSQFNYNFYDASSYSDGYWNLTWSTKDGNAGIQVNCDENFHITYYNKYDYSKTETGISKYLKKELKSKADDFILKAAPDTIGSLQYLDSEFDGIYSGNYVYRYQRAKNGVPLPENTVTCYVSSITGEVTSLTVDWLYEGKVPSSTTKITKEEATKLIKKNMNMKLVYRTNQYWLYDSKGGSQATKAFLVYEPTESYLSVDANTGKIYLTKSEWVNTAAQSGAKTAEDAATSNIAAGSTIQLTPEEVAQAEELQGLISKEKAIKTVTGNKSLYLDKNLISYTATLSKQESSSGKASFVWNISLNDPREIDSTSGKDTYRGYAYATVDAKTGNLLSYNASMNGYYNETTQKWMPVKIKYNKKESRAILEKFLKQQINSKFKNTVFTEQNDDYIASYKNDTPVYGGYRYQYNRTNEGIEYPYNSVYGSVDGVTGKIYSFGSYWNDEIVFESPKNIISAEAAMNAYLANEGFGLKYEINQINKYDSSKAKDGYYDYSGLSSVEYEIRLVYRADITPSYISPFTGKQLNYDGTEYTVTKPYAYLDLNDEAKYRNILLLADMNIGFDGEKFLPDQAITVGEINSLLEKIGYGSYTTEADATVNSSELITREKIAQTFVDKLGLDKLSKLSGIYKTGYTDESSINKDYLGAVAIAKGFGLLGGDENNNFNPQKNISRYDAVNLLLNFIQLQKEGLN